MHSDKTSRRKDAFEQNYRRRKVAEPIFSNFSKVVYLGTL
jgi:hypothetical protein